MEQTTNRPSGHGTRSWQKSTITPQNVALCFLCHAVQNSRDRTKAMAAPPHKASANAPKGMQTRTRKRQNPAKRKAKSGFSPRHWPWTAGQKTANRIAKHRLSRHGGMSLFAQTNAETTYNAHFLTFTFAHFLRQFFRRKTVCRQKNAATGSQWKTQWKPKGEKHFIMTKRGIIVFIFFNNLQM